MKETIGLFVLVLFFCNCARYEIASAKYAKIEGCFTLDEQSVVSHSNPQKIPKLFIKEIGEVYFGYKLKGIACNSRDKQYHKSGLRIITYEETKEYQILGLRVSGDILTNVWFLKRKIKQGELSVMSSAFVNSFGELKSCINGYDNACRLDLKVYCFKGIGK